MIMGRRWWFWPFGKSPPEPERAKQDTDSEIDVASLDVDALDDVPTGEFQAPEDMFTDDLPENIKKDKKRLKRIRKADIHAKRAYDAVDEHVEKLRDIRRKIENSSKRKK